MAASSHMSSCRACNFDTSSSYFPEYFCPSMMYERKWRNSDMEDLTTMSSEEKLEEKNEENIDETAAQETRTRRRRATYKRWQLDILEEAFEGNCYPSTMLKKFLAARLGMENIQVQVWFQNRRARMKKDGSERYSPYGRNYPLTLRLEAQSLNRRASSYPYFPNSPPVTPMFSRWDLDRVLHHHHPGYHMCSRHTVPHAADVMSTKLLATD